MFTAYILIWIIIHLLKHKINVVHTHHTKSALLGLIFKIFFRPYFIHTVHNNFLVGYNKIQKSVFILSFTFADRLIANSFETFKSLPLFINKDKKVVIHNFIDDIMDLRILFNKGLENNRIPISLNYLVLFRPS